MKKGCISEKLQKLLSVMRGGQQTMLDREPQYFSRQDAAVLKVAMMVAALDGTITDEELASFEKLAKKCRGYNAESAKTLFRDCLRSAGYVELASRTLSQRDLQAVFLEEAKDILSDGFVKEDAVGIRAAFVTWLAMAMSDGDFSTNERKAIRAFADHVVEVVEERSAANRRRQSLSPAFATAYREHGIEADALSPAFFDRAEAILAKMNQAETTASAAAELKALIANG